MGLWSRRRGRQIMLLTLISVSFILGGAWVVHASAPEQGDATPPATAELISPDAQASGKGAAPAVLGSTQQMTPTLTPTAPPPTSTPTPVPGPANVIKNGGFEEGFLEGQGVGVNWGRFQTGDVFAGWYDDTWTKVVYEGEHAQLIELRDASQQSQYAGIFQTVNVVSGAEYLLTLHGMVRSDSGSPDLSNYGFEMEYGIDYSGGSDWKSSSIEWITLPWEEQLRTDPTRIDSYTATVKATGPQLTLFVRALKKWADAVEGNYDVDGVSLVGPQPGGAPPTATPAATAEPGMPVTGNEFSFLGNPVLVVPSIALLVILIGGAAWGLRRRGV
jgi:hypothetical protein